MTTSIIKFIQYLTITISISFFCVESAIAQNIDRAFNYAEHQYKNGQFTDAIKLYRRIAFFGSSTPYLPVVYERLGNCYFETQDYGLSGKYYDFAYFASGDDSLKQEIVFKKTVSLIFDQKYKYALLELMNIKDAENDYFGFKKSFYQGFIYFKLNDFPASEIAFLKALDNATPKDKIIEVFNKNKKTNRIKPNAAKIMSLIIPGSGQIYIGDFKNGINSLVLVGSLGILFGYTAMHYSLLDAFFSVMPWYQRYYIGGADKAKNKAIDKISEKRNQNLNKILEIMALSKQKKLH